MNPILNVSNTETVYQIYLKEVNSRMLQIIFKQILMI